jgi:hypothetical protein
MAIKLSFLCYSSIIIEKPNASRFNQYNLGLSDGYIYCLIGTSHLGKKWIMNEIVGLMIICPLMVMVGLGMGFALLWLQQQA